MTYIRNIYIYVFYFNSRWLRKNRRTIMLNIFQLFLIQNVDFCREGVFLEFSTELWALQLLTIITKPYFWSSVNK